MSLSHAAMKRTYFLETPFGCSHVSNMAFWLEAYTTHVVRQGNRAGTYLERS